jgi:hypothetical protein
MYKLLRKPNKNTNKEPTMPILVVFNDGSVFESDSITSIISIMAGEEYIMLNSKDKYLKRIEIARREAMFSLQYDINIVVSDGKRIIENNYAADPDDEDYKYEDGELKNALMIRVDDEKEFLISLVKLGSIRILERADNNIFFDEKSPDEILKKEYIDISLSFNR